MKAILRLFCCVLLIIAFTELAKGQEVRILLQANEYFPIGTSNKEYYPFLWYKDRDDLGFLFGGFGVGVSYRQRFKEKEQLGQQAKLILHRFRQFGEPVLLRDVNGSPLGAIGGITTEYAANLSYLLRYEFNSYFSIGAGLGASVLIHSSTDYGETIFFGEKEEIKSTNRHYLPVVAVLPVEIGLTFGRWNIDLKTEFSLHNRIRSNTLSSEYFILSSLELGYLLQKNSE